MQSDGPQLSSLPNVSGYRQILDHPGFRMFEFLLALLGTLLAIFFYYQSKSRKEPYFYVDPTRNILVSRELSIGDKLTVTFDGRPAPRGDITAMQCYFWNAGRTAIHGIDTLQPIKLRLDPGNEILDVSVIRQSRPDIMQFRVVADRNPDGTFSNTASISFAILEQDDGVSLQILYVGGPQVALTFSGAIEGAKIKRLPRPLDALRDRGSRETEIRKSAKQATIIAALFPLVFLMFPVMAFLEASHRNVKRLWMEYAALFKSRAVWLSYFIWLVIVASVFYYLFYFYPAIPQDVLS